MDDIKTFLNALAGEPERQAFAQRCGTTIKHLRNVVYGVRPCSPKLAAALERESHGKLHVERLCPQPDGGKWTRQPDPKWLWHAAGRPLVDLTAPAA